MPYVVLEIAAAGRPMIATNVGGIPEIYGELSHLLVPPGDSPALAEAIRRCLADPSASAANAELLRARIAAGFSVDAMVDGVLAGYQQALERTLAPGRAQLARA
jgi:glycosyltransferase involved in cell wall biosynthesis